MNRYILSLATICGLLNLASSFANPAGGLNTQDNGNSKQCSKIDKRCAQQHNACCEKAKESCCDNSKQQPKSAPGCCPGPCCAAGSACCG